MNELDFDPVRDERVRQAMRRLAESHQPNPARDRSAARRHRWLGVAAAAVLVGGGVVAVVALADRDTAIAPSGTIPPIGSTTPPATSPPSDSSTPAETAPPVASGRPNADGDIPIDPNALRFADPLADEAVAFVDDPALPAPQLGVDEPVVVGDEHADREDAVRFVAMDGARLLMRGSVVDLAAADAPPATGAAVDVGVGGARYVDDDEGAVVVPLADDRVRLVAPDDYFRFGGGGPHVDPDILLAVTRAVGTAPIAEVDSLPGFFVDDGVIDGETIDPLGMRGGVRVEHGTRTPGSTSVTLLRLARPPTALDLIAIGNALVRRGEIDPPAVGDVTAFVAEGLYLELVSPVDLLILSTGAGQDVAAAYVDALDVATLETLDAAFDGSVQAPPAPG